MRTERIASPLPLAALGAIVFALGVLVYAIDRIPGHALLIPHVDLGVARPIFGALGAWLPSFVHPFAFSLFTAALGPAGAGPAWRACAAWWAIDVAFELAQHASIAPALVAALDALSDRNALTRPLANYLLHGRFDIGDLVAVTAGALAAAAVLHLHHARGRHAR